MPASKKPTASEQDPADEPTFEKALEGLREIVEGMEEGSLPLNELIARYEQGVKLADQCARALEAAEKRVRKIAESSGGLPEISAFDENGTDG